MNDIAADMVDNADTAITQAGDDVTSKVASLQAQLNALLTDRVRPAMANATDRVTAAAKQARDYASDSSESLASTVKEQPLIAVAVAVAVGYLLGRVVR